MSQPTTKLAETLTVAAADVATSGEPLRHSGRTHQSDVPQDQETTSTAAGSLYQFPARQYDRKPIRFSVSDMAYDYIRRVASPDDIRPNERSNYFDAWKEALARLASHPETISIQYNQILGMLIASVHKKDVIDFSADALKSFKIITNLLRKPKPSDLHVTHAARLIDQCKIVPIIPMNTIGLTEEDEAELDQMMRALVEKSIQ